MTLEGTPDGGRSLKSLCDEAGSWHMVDCVLQTLRTFDLLLKNSFWISFLDCCSTRRLSRNFVRPAWLRVNVLEHWNRRIVLGCCFCVIIILLELSYCNLSFVCFLYLCYRDLVSVVDRVGDLWSERCCRSRFARFTAAAAAAACCCCCCCCCCWMINLLRCYVGLAPGSGVVKEKDDAYGKKMAAREEQSWLH